MAKYLVLYTSEADPTEMMESMTPEQSAAGMQLWMDWAKSCGDALIDLGSPLGPGSRVEGGEAGPGTSLVCGYSVMQGDDIGAINALWPTTRTSTPQATRASTWCPSWPSPACSSAGS